jgi:hypothetical protein
VFHHGRPLYELRYDRCGHTSVVEAARRELEHMVKMHYASCQRCARPLRWICPGCALFRAAIAPVAVHQVCAPLAGLGIRQQVTWYRRHAEAPGPWGP